MHVFYVRNKQTNNTNHTNPNPTNRTHNSNPNQAG